MAATDEYGWHEVMDRAAVLAAVFSDYVADAPVVKADAKLHRLAGIAVDRMGDFYDAVASKHLGTGREPSTALRQLRAARKARRKAKRL